MIAHYVTCHYYKSKHIRLHDTVYFNSETRVLEITTSECQYLSLHIKQYLILGQF